ncbi:gem-associated protein 5-like [Elysia marginata]|uniref:Gem-associated protein 5-like n=1 Tax=Elysia marginata TaxID=1093978 RepID=A0AAV4IES8_9GAST|nr:gem-associated protein 5-like [Elysia marginata]
MGDFVLPPSPNWFLPSVSSGSESGLYAFGSKSEVVVYDISSNKSKEDISSQQTSVSSQDQPQLKFLALYSGHNNKVVGVCLSPDPTQWTCCSCQEDIIQLWDVRSLVTIQEVSVEIKAKLTCLSWSAADIDAVYASSDKGSVLIWDLKSSTLSSYDLSRENIMIMCIAASPHHANFAAVGYRTGMAAVVSFENGRALTLHRLRSQEAEIYSISWCPVKGEDFTKWGQTPEEEGALLAVAGRQCLRVWSSLRGKEIFSVKVHQGSVSRRETNDPPGKKNWVDVIWSKQIPHHIIFSGFQGDLFYIDIRNEKKEYVEKFVLNGINKHNRMIFNVVEAGERMCTFAVDRTMAIWDNKSKSGHISYTSFAGTVFCARVSPLDPGRIAVGAGDNNIRIWNQNNKSNPGDILHLHSGIRSKVTHVAWHPEKEGLLAYGLEDGSVGVYNTVSSKVPELSGTFHAKTVYVVCWAPALKAERGSSELQVYSVGDGTVLQHFINQSKREAVNLIEAIEGIAGKPDKPIIISELSWRFDYTVFALGRVDGSVAVYAFPSLELLCLIEIQTKLINCVCWHPLTTVQSPTLSPYSTLVAFAGNDYCISIVNLKDFLLGLKPVRKGESAAKEAAHITEGQGILPVGKSNRVTDLSWSPHQDGLLASANYDGVATVWDVRTMTQLASYKHNHGRLMTVVWSHLDSDLVMSGGTDSTFRRWRVSAQPKEVGKNKKKRKGGAKARAIDDGTKSEDTASTSDMKELVELLKSKEKQLLAQVIVVVVVVLVVVVVVVLAVALALAAEVVVGGGGVAVGGGGGEL